VLNPKDNWALQTPNAKVVVPLAGCVMGIAMFVKSLDKESFGGGEETSELMVHDRVFGWISLKLKYPNHSSAKGLIFFVDVYIT